MQYFTPELFVRLQDLSDRNAAREWDRASDRYSRSLKESLARLPAAVRTLIRQYPLHDAEVVCISQSHENLSITLKPESANTELVILSYKLAAPLDINRSAIPARFQTDHVAWLFDEISEKGPSAKKRSRERSENSEAPVYCHNVLLSNGWEMRLRFRQIRITRSEGLLPASGQCSGKLRYA